MNEQGGAGFGKNVRASLPLVALAVRLTWQGGPHLVFGLLLLLLLQSLLPPLQLVLTKAVVDRAALDLDMGGSAGVLAARLPLTVWIALAALVVALAQLIQPVSRTLQAMAGDRLTGHFTERVMQATNRWQGLTRFEDPGVADDLERVRSGANDMALQLLLNGANVFLQLFTMSFLVLTLIGLHPVAPLVLVLATLPMMATMWDYMGTIGSHLYYKAPEARRLEYNREVVLAPEPAKDVRLYRLTPFFADRYNMIFDRTIGRLDQVRRRLAVKVGLANLLSAAAAAGIFGYTVLLISRGERSPGDLMLYGGAATMLRTTLGELGQLASYWPMAFGAYLPSLHRVLTTPPDLPQPTRPRPVPRPAREGFVFEDVEFTYPGTDQPVLRGVSFAIRPGETVALVGHNGAGKTTIVKLLLRFYDPTAGRILLDGVDIRDYDLDDLRREMGVIFQDFVRYELTARENIGVGQLDALEKDAALLEAARKSGALDLVERLPEGLDTWLGREFGGRELSGGEWQRLALARAFVRDCQLLVLDEPTAALDVQTEYDVYTRFHELTRERMMLLISHRFSTVRMADRIIYLEDGRVREEGSHAELMARDGDYARLYRLQASRYLEEQPEELRS